MTTPAAAAEKDTKLDEQLIATPLFEMPAGTEVDSILIQRIEPLIEKGTLGRLDPSATDLDIKERWGGGKYIAEGRNSRGQIAGKGFRRIIEIGGDPKFESEVNRRRWMTQHGITDPAPTGVAAAPVAAGMSFGEVFALMQATASEARTSAEAAHTRQIEIMRADQERRDREMLERADRSEKDRAEREERRRREDAEADARRVRELEDSRARDREHQKAILELLASKQAPAAGTGDSMAIFIKGFELAKDVIGAAGGGKDGDDDEGDGGGDPVSRALTEAVRALPSAIREFRSGAPAAATDAPPPGADPAAVTLTGPTADVMRHFVEAQRKAGRDPEAVLTSALRTLSKPVDATPTRTPVKRSVVRPAGNDSPVVKPPVPAPAPTAAPENSAA